ncbi:MAG: protein adenylyltransferase SelO, partial [Alphaproteobacteria bacterium]
MPLSPHARPSAAHAALGPDLYDPVEPARFPRHDLRFRNDRWAARIGLDALTDAEWVAHLGRFEPVPGSMERPLALRYHGHQFRVYNPDLGDGRGFLFAQLHDLGDGRLLDLGTKGSGQTPWSRGGDGRLTLKGGVREILATEMLEALGVETSKTLSLIETGEDLHRGDEPSPTRSSVLVRLSHSHIRIGTFQRLLYLGDTAGTARLLDHCIATYLPEARSESQAERAAAFLEAVCGRVATMGAQWLAAGFVHGVLNSDNINVTGESFDYGPWRFLPALDPRFTAAYFDHGGLYAFGRQHEALAWNLTRLAECLVPVGERGELQAVLGRFQDRLHAAFVAALLRRLGVRSAGAARDDALMQAFWSFLGSSGAPFERTFYDWYGGAAAAPRAKAGPSGALYETAAFAAVRTALDGFEPVPEACTDHPYFGRGTACTMLIDEVEALWAPIAERDDWSAFRNKIADIREMGRASGNEPAPPGGPPIRAGGGAGPGQAAGA